MQTFIVQILPRNQVDVPSQLSMSHNDGPWCFQFRISWSDHQGHVLMVTALLFDPQHGPGLWATAVPLFWDIILFTGTQKQNVRGWQILEEGLIHVLFSKDKAGCEKPQGTVWCFRGSHAGWRVWAGAGGLKKEVVTGTRREVCGSHLRSQPGLHSQGALTQSLPTSLPLPSRVPHWLDPARSQESYWSQSTSQPPRTQGRHRRCPVDGERMVIRAKGRRQPSISESLSGASTFFSWFMQHKTLSGQQFAVWFGCIFWVCSRVSYLQFVLGEWLCCGVGEEKSMLNTEISSPKVSVVSEKSFRVMNLDE